MDPTLREGRFEQGAVLGTVSFVGGIWRAFAGALSAESDTLVGACIAVTGGSTELVLSDIGLTDEEVAGCMGCGVPFVAGSDWIHNAHLTAREEGTVMEHPDFEDVATVWGPPAGSEYEPDSSDSEPDDEPDDDREIYYRLGRLGHLYFELDYGPVTWSFIGWFDNPQDAADAVAFSGDGLTVEMSHE